MLPSLMSQMGMTTDRILASEADQHKSGDHHQTSDSYTGANYGAAAAVDDDDEVPGMLIQFI